MAENSKILITGVSGFLGTALVEKLLSEGESIIGISQNEGGLAEVKMKYPSLETYICDIGHDTGTLDLIFKNNEIKSVIHCAAIKRIEMAQSQPMRTVITNVVGTLHILEFARKYGVERLITISTDKAVNPKGVYGMSKSLGERMTLECGYDVFQGINFFGSTGSVIPIWHKQSLAGKDLTLNNPDHVRYFQIIEDVVGDILGILHHPLNKIHSPTNALEVKIGDLLEAFMALTSYDRYIITGELEIEKDKEETLHALDARKPTHEELKKLLEEYYFRRL